MLPQFSSPLTQVCGRETITPMWCQWKTDSLGNSGFCLGLLPPGPVSSAERLVNGKQGACCLGATNPSFMRPEISTVFRGASLRQKYKITM